MTDGNIYPELKTEEQVIDLIDLKVKKEIEKVDSISNKIRINSIKDFIKSLNDDFIKYQKKKHKYSIIKNVLTIFDIGIGGTLTIAGVVLEVITLGGSTPVSIALGSIGIGMVSILPISHKISDKFENKTRNFQILASNKIEKVKLIFSRALEDNYISGEEFELVMTVKKEYYEAKLNLKKLNKKEIDSMFQECKNVIGTSFKQIDIDTLRNDIEKQSQKKALSEVKKEIVEKKKQELKERIGYL